jgi:hypothetical protein
MTTPLPDAIGIVRSLLADGLEVGEARRAGPLLLVPLSGGRPARGYRTAGAAVADGTFRIGETAGGRVPQLVVRNSGDLPVLLLDGEHLEGAMQDRVLNVTVLVAARHDTLIPVSCVERGRWGYRTSAPAGFAPSTYMAPSRLRAMKAEQVMSSARSGAGRRTDQARVWKEVADARGRLKASPSATGALGAAYHDRERDLDAIAREAGDPGGANGVVAFAGKRPLALDLFDRSETLAEMWPRLVRGYAADALDRGSPAEVDLGAARAFLGGLASPDAEATAHEGVGLGIDVILTTQDSVADALVWNDAVVHLAAFPRSSRPERGRRSLRAGAIDRPSDRRRRRGDAWFHDAGGAR